MNPHDVVAKLCFDEGLGNGFWWGGPNGVLKSLHHLSFPELTEVTAFSSRGAGRVLFCEALETPKRTFRRLDFLKEGQSLRL